MQNAAAVSGASAPTPCDALPVSRRAAAGALAAALLASGGPAGARRGDRPLLAVHLPGRVPYFGLLTKGLVDAARDRFDVSLAYANWDPHEQLRQIEASMLSRADVIAVCASDNLALEVLPSLLARRQRPIALLTFTNAIGRARDGSGAGIAGFAGRDEIESGHLLGQFTERVVGAGPARVLMVEGSPGTTPQRLRSQGFGQVAQRFPRWLLAHRITVQGWRTDLAELQLRRINPRNYDIVVTQWAAAAVAAVRAFSGAGRVPPPVVTLEYTAEVRAELLSGRVAWTTFHDIEQEGREVVGLALDALDGEVARPFRRSRQFEIDAAAARIREAQW